MFKRHKELDVMERALLTVQSQYYEWDCGSTCLCGHTWAAVRGYDVTHPQWHHGFRAMLSHKRLYRRTLRKIAKANGTKGTVVAVSRLAMYGGRFRAESLLKRAIRIEKERIAAAMPPVNIHTTEKEELHVPVA